MIFLLATVVPAWASGGATGNDDAPAQRTVEPVPTAGIEKGRILMNSVGIRPIPIRCAVTAARRPGRTPGTTRPAAEFATQPAAPAPEVRPDSTGSDSVSGAGGPPTGGAMPAWLAEAGMLGGYGFGGLPEGRYRPLLLGAHFGTDLGGLVGIPAGHRGRLTFFVEPLFNPVHEPSGEYEFGIGAGLQYAYPVFRNVLAYAAVSCGPHFISVDTERQSDGFVFDSEFGGGLYVSLGKWSALNIGYRYRHLSNGGIAKPNTGINNHFVIIGYSLFHDLPGGRQDRRE